MYCVVRGFWGLHEIYFTFAGLRAGRFFVRKEARCNRPGVRADGSLQ